MPRKTAPLLPATEELLRQFGERLRLARLRRRLSAKQVAERAGMNPMTLRSLERGGSGVTMGAYVAVMQVLGIEKELDHLAEADPLGRSLQDAQLSNPAAERALDEIFAAPERRRTVARQKATHVPRRSAKSSPDASEPTNWVSSRKLANLLSDGRTKRSSSKSRRR